MHQTSKSDLECLESVVPDVDVKIVDCAALVRILDPKKSQVSVKTFHDYAQLVFSVSPTAPTFQLTGRASFIGMQTKIACSNF